MFLCSLFVVVGGRGGGQTHLSFFLTLFSSLSYLVIVGAVIGHALCTGGAVIGGRLIANYVSEKFVLISGGILFISFGIGGVLVEVLNLY